MTREPTQAPTPPPPTVLVVDDEDAIREMLCEFLTLQGYRVHEAQDGRLALDLIQQVRADLVLTDMKMPSMGGIELLGELARLRSPPTTILMTGYGTVDTAIAAMKHGAYDYIIKPFKLKEVAATITRALEKTRLERENLKLRGTTSLYHLSEAATSSDSLDNLFEIYCEVSLDELQADVILLLMESPIPGEYGLASFYCRNPIPEEELGELAAGIDLARVMVPFLGREPLIVHDDDVFAYLPEDFLPAPYSLLGLPLRLASGHVAGITLALSTDPLHRFQEGHRKMGSVLAAKVAYAVEKTQLYGQIGDHRRQTLEGLANILMAKDAYIRYHSEAVARMSRMICEEMGLDELTTETIHYGGLLHDVGKIGIRLDKLHSPGRLSTEDVDVMRQHPDLAKFILEPLNVLEEVKPIVYHHHERWDGRGYPGGLRGEEIPLGARVVAVADAYDAITSKRIYVQDTTHETAVAEIGSHRGTQFDPTVVDAFLRGIEAFRDRHGDFHDRVDEMEISTPTITTASYRPIEDD